MKYCRVIDNEICFHEKESYDVYEMFHTRFFLFKRIYTHRTCKSQKDVRRKASNNYSAKAVELMIVDAIIKAEPFLNLKESINDPKDYLRVTDSILERIEFSSEPVCLPALTTG